MATYMQEDCNAFPLDDQYALEFPRTEDTSNYLSDWCQWGYIRPDLFVSSSIHSDISEKYTLDKFALDGQTASSQCINGPVGKDFISVASGDPTVNCSLRSCGQPAFQLQDCKDFTDEVWNSLLEEDNRDMHKIVQPFHIAPDAISGSQSFENFLTEMFTDAESLPKEMTRREASEPTVILPQHTNYLSESLGKIEDSSTSCLMVEDYKRSEVPATTSEFAPIERNASNQSVTFESTGTSTCWEAALLMELENMLIHMNDNLRICFRDSINRLAKSSKEQAINQHRGAITDLSLMEVNSEHPSLKRSRHKESTTNALDRTIANLIFNENYFHAPVIPCSGYQQSSGSYYSTHPM